jgi:hypothetical protein
MRSRACFGTLGVVVLSLLGGPALAAPPGSTPSAVVASASDKAQNTPTNPCDHLPSPALRHNPHCTHGGDPVEEPDPNDPDAAAEPDAPASVPPAPCPGDGESGRRVHVLYGYPQGTGNRIDEKAGAIRTRVDRANFYLNRSGSKDVGSQDVRWLCREDRHVRVTAVQMKAIGPDGQFTFSDMVDSLRRQVELGLGPVNYADPSRIYLVFMDNVRGLGAYSFGGQANLSYDDRPDPAVNSNNHAERYAMIAQLSGTIALHELGHTLGAVQFSAPHSSKAGHCYQERDVMCYDDGGPYFSQGGEEIVTCPESPSWKFDCGKDDYYHPAPDPGSYLGTHWNTSNSGWLTPVR